MVEGGGCCQWSTFTGIIPVNGLFLIVFGVVWYAKKWYGIHCSESITCTYHLIPALDSARRPHPDQLQGHWTYRYSRLHLTSPSSPHAQAPGSSRPASRHMAAS